MNILIGTLIFNGYTGSEWYNYELARCLASMKNEKGKPLHKVTIFSNTFPETSLNGKLRKLGVNFINSQKQHTLPNGFDVVHFSHKPVGEHLLKQINLKRARFITTNHSEIISLEFPVINDRIQKYISIRPTIRTMLESQFGIPADKIVDIWNPIDDSRFNEEGTQDLSYILFHGSLDYLRRKSALHCIDYAKGHNLEVVFVGRNDFPDEFNETKMPNCTFVKPQPDLSEFVKNCHMTAGILLGRSTIEGYFCGKRGLIYDVDNRGEIFGVEDTFETGSELDKYRAELVANQILELYNGKN